jgi:hypothetical protein
VQTLERQQAGLSTSVDAFWAQQPAPEPASGDTLVVNTVDGKDDWINEPNKRGSRM